MNRTTSQLELVQRLPYLVYYWEFGMKSVIKKKKIVILKRVARELKAEYTTPMRMDRLLGLLQGPSRTCAPAQ